jgi:hypothetical protein
VLAPGWRGVLRTDSGAAYLYQPVKTDGMHTLLKEASKWKPKSMQNK